MNIWDKYRYKPNTSIYLAAMFESEHAINLVGIDFSIDRPSLVFVERVEADNFLSLKRAFNAFIEQKKLFLHNCSWVMQPHDYKLLLLDTPNVDNKELRKALRWYVTEMFSVPLEKTIFDYFLIPPPPAHDKSKMVYVVATELEPVIKKASILESAGLNLFLIDIPELTLKNILSMLPQSSEGQVFLCSIGEQIMLIVCQADNLFLTRRMAIKINNENVSSKKSNHSQAFLKQKRNEENVIDKTDSTDTTKASENLLDDAKILDKDKARVVSPNEALELLSKEIERSIAFCENTLELSPPKHIVTLGNDPIQDISHTLAKHLNMPLHMFDINSVLTTNGLLNDYNINDLFILSAAFKRPMDYATAN